MAILPSPGSGGSEGTTDRVFRQFGHIKQFRAHLPQNKQTRRAKTGRFRPVLLRAYAGTRNLKKTIGAVVATDFDRHASVTPHSVAFLAEKKRMERMETMQRRG
jgi:hypothetical protein